MKRLISCAAIAGMLVLAFGPARAHATIFSFDENGNGAIDGAAWTGTVGLMADPTNGVAGNVLTYMLPPNMLAVQGDIVIYEPGGVIIGDVLRFTNAAGSLSGGGFDDRVIFYSTAGGSDLADTGLPTNGTDVFGYTTENADGSFSFFSGFAVYSGTSDSSSAAVPAPTSLVMSLILFGMFGMVWLHKRLTQVREAV